MSLVRGAAGPGPRDLGARSQPERVGRDGEDGGDADDRAREDDEDGSGGVGLPRAGRSRRRSTAPASGLFVVRGRGGGDAEQLLVDAPAPSSHASAVASRVATRAKDARDARRRHYRPREGDDRRDATRIFVEGGGRQMKRLVRPRNAKQVVKSRLRRVGRLSGRRRRSRRARIGAPLGPRRRRDGRGRAGHAFPARGRRLRRVRELRARGLLS